MVPGKSDLHARGEGMRDAGSIPELQRAPGGGHSNSLQYSCLEDLLDRGAWGAESDATKATEHATQEGLEIT